MCLRKLTISGFKSFAQPTELSFDMPISAIVGPNGSGKSNITEALRFVFGEQSMKSMRGDRSEDMIFNGGQSGKRLNRARVAIHLDNSRGLFDLPYDEVVIERLVHRDGKSEYRVNGSLVRLKDVREILAFSTVGSKNHHIVSQGEADQLLYAKSEDRKRILEDALGLEGHILKIEETEARLETVIANRKEAESEAAHARSEFEELQTLFSKREQGLQKMKELRAAAKKFAYQSEALYQEATKEYVQKRDDLAKRLEEFSHDETEKKEEDQSLTDLRKQVKEKESVVITLRRTSQQKIVDETRLEVKEQELSLKLKHLSQEKGGKVEVVESHVQDVYEKLQGAEKALNEEKYEPLKKTLSDVTSEVKKWIESTTKEDRKQEEESLKMEHATIVKNLSVLTKEKEEVERELEKTTEELDLLRKTLYQEEARRKQGKEQSEAVTELEGTLAREKREVVSKLESLKQEHALRQERVREALSLTAEAVTTDEDEQPFEALSLEELSTALVRLGTQLEQYTPLPPQSVERERRYALERTEFLEHQLHDLEETEGSLRSLVEEMKEHLHITFTEGLAKVNKEFSLLVSKAFGGGKAELRLTKPREDDRGEGKLGLDIEISIPRKKLHNLSMLSGGEKALVSLSLLFAMARVATPPFIVLDETDAALDEANSHRYGELIEELSENSQLIVVTHNRQTMHRAGTLYGITMGGDGISRLLSVQLGDKQVEEILEEAKT